MATSGTVATGITNPTLLDMIKARAPDGTIARTVKALDQKNPILKDATAQEANKLTSHQITVDSSLPTLAWRSYNQGVAASKGTTIQVEETMGMLAGLSKLDVTLAPLGGNEAAYRAQLDSKFVSKFNNDMASALFYSNIEQYPKQMQGLTPRYNDTDLQHVINYAAISGDTADTADNSSIWFITWSPETCYLIYPKGSMAGLTKHDMGEQLVNDGDGNAYAAYVTRFQWDIGLAVEDWRYNARICNIDSDTIDLTANIGLIETAMIEAVNRLQDRNTGRLVCYMSRQVKTWLERQTAAKSGMNFTPVDWHGKQIMGFQGIPIVTCDALIATETVVST